MPLGLWGTMRALITAADMCKWSAGASPSKALSTSDLCEVSGSLSGCRSRVHTYTLSFLLELLCLQRRAEITLRFGKVTRLVPSQAVGCEDVSFKPSPVNPQDLVHCCQMCGAGEEAGGGEEGPWVTGCCTVEPRRMCYFLCTSTRTLFLPGCNT